MLKYHEYIKIGSVLMEQMKQILDELMHNNNFLIGVIVVCVALLILIFMFTYLNKKDARQL